MTKDEALRMALEALETCNWVDDGGYGQAEYDHVSTNKAITAIRDALAQPEQDPVATWENKYGMKEWQVHALRAGWSITPPHRKPLTDEDLIECERLASISHRKYMGSIRGQQLSLADQFLWHYARAIEQAHGIKG